MDTEDRNNMQAVIDAARAGTEPMMVPREPASSLAFLPLKSEGRIESLEAHLPAPLRKRGVIKVFDAASFNQVLHDNADAGNVAVYLDRNPDTPAIVGILNGHGPGGPGWGDMRVDIEFRPTPQWAKWRKIDGVMLEQAKFAEFIEDNVEDVAEPSGASVLEMVTQLQATRTTEFRKAIRLSNGQVQFTHSEDIQASVGAGQVAVPEAFKLALSPIQGVPPYSVPARFRFRLSDGKLTMGVKLQRIEDLMRVVIEDVVAKIERGANVSVLDGRAPDAVKA